MKSPTRTEPTIRVGLLPAAFRNERSRTARQGRTLPLGHPYKLPSQSHPVHAALAATTPEYSLRAPCDDPGTPESCSSHSPLRAREQEVAPLQEAPASAAASRNTSPCDL